VSGRIRGDDNDVVITAVPLMEGQPGGRAPVDIGTISDEGRYDLRGLTPGSYLLSAHLYDAAPDLRHATRVQLAAGQAATVDLVPSRARRPMWDDEALARYGAAVDALCACLSDSCRRDAADAITAVEDDYDMMDAATAERLSTINAARSACEK
jgi:hypothetical protein